MIIQIPSFFSPLIDHSAVIRLVQKNRQVKSSLCPGEKDMDSPGFEPPTSQYNTWCIKLQDHGALLKLPLFGWEVDFKFCRELEMDNCKNELWSHKGQINHVKDIDSFSLRGVKELSHYIYWWQVPIPSQRVVTYIHWFLKTKFLLLKLQSNQRKGGCH